MNAGLPPEFEALALAELARQAKSRTAAVKAVIGDRYAPGQRETFRSPVDGAKLGMVLRTDPDPEWRVVDREKLAAHLRADPANLETVYEIGDESAAVEVLRKHAPHLLVEITRVSVDARGDAVARAAAGETVPGVARVKPEGVLTVRPDRGAAAAIAGMVRAGILSWDGRPAIDQAEAAS